MLRSPARPAAAREVRLDQIFNRPAEKSAKPINWFRILALKFLHGNNHQNAAHLFGRFQPPPSSKNPATSKLTKFQPPSSGFLPLEIVTGKTRKTTAPTGIDNLKSSLRRKISKAPTTFKTLCATRQNFTVRVQAPVLLAGTQTRCRVGQARWRKTSTKLPEEGARPTRFSWVSSSLRRDQVGQAFSNPVSRHAPLVGILVGILVGVP